MSQAIPVQLDSDLGGAEIILQRMSDLLVEGNGQQIAEAFRRMDRDGSGYLDGPEFCAALRQVISVPGHHRAALLFHVLRSASPHRSHGLAGPGHDHCG